MGEKAEEEEAKMGGAIFLVKEKASDETAGCLVSAEGSREGRMMMEMMMMLMMMMMMMRFLYITYDAADQLSYDVHCRRSIK